MQSTLRGGHQDDTGNGHADLRCKESELRGPQEQPTVGGHSERAAQQRPSSLHTPELSLPGGDPRPRLTPPASVIPPPSPPSQRHPRLPGLPPGTQPRCPGRHRGRTHGLEVAVNDFLRAQHLQALQDREGDAPDDGQTEALKSVAFHRLIQVDSGEETGRTRGVNLHAAPHRPGFPVQRQAFRVPQTQVTGAPGRCPAVLASQLSPRFLCDKGIPSLCCTLGGLTRRPL